MIVLSIGIPSFNRSGKLKSQLDFLYGELNELTDEERSYISLFVSDNCSTDNTKDVVANSSIFLTNCVNCTYLCNTTNLGLSGNLQRLYSVLDGEYIWVIGDDDCLKQGIVRQVLEECFNCINDYIFVNHSITKNGKLVKESVLKGIETSRSDKMALWDLYKLSGTVMMLISACVYRNSLVKDYLSKYEVDLVVPCSLSFYCASQGRTKFIEEPFLVNDQTENSWGKMIVKVFFDLLPSLLLRMPQWGYNRKECLFEYCKLKRDYIRPKLKEVLHRIQL